MCAFRRTISNTSDFTNHKNFGISFLDNIIGPIGPGTCVLFEENRENPHHINFARVFASQAIHNQENVLLISKDMTNIKLPSKNEEKRSEQDILHDMKIAWRYRSLKSNNTEQNFDFTKTLKQDINMDLDRKDSLKQKLKKISILPDNSKIVIFSLFSPIWKYSENLKNLDIQKFLYDLKMLARNKKLTIFVTIPTYFYNFNFRLYFDVVLKNIDSDIYDGLIEFVKLRKSGKIKSHDLKTLKYGYWVKKTGIHVEYINMPPE